MEQDQNSIRRKVRSRNSIYKAWEALQTKVRSGSAGEYIGQKTTLTIAGNDLELHRKPRTSIVDFEKEARAIKFLK